MRLNIENNAFGDPRLNALEKLFIANPPPILEIARQAALGALTQLWHESQSRELTAASADEIELWAGCKGIVDWLVQTKYLTQTNDGKYKIAGNEEQIESVREYLEKKSLAGKEGMRRRWQKGSSVITPDNTVITSDSRPITPDSTRITKHNQLQLQLQIQDQDQYLIKDIDRRSDPDIGFDFAPPDFLQAKKPSDQNTKPHPISRAPACASACGDGGMPINFESIEKTVDEEKNNFEPIFEPQPPLETQSPETPPDLPKKRTKKSKSEASREPVEGGLTPEACLQIWNDKKSVKQPGVKALTAKRETAIRSALDVFSLKGDWETAVERVASWRFGNGENDSGWVANFDWLISPRGLRAFEGPLQTAIVRRDKFGNIDSRDNHQKMSDEEFAELIKRKTILGKKDVENK